MALAAASIEPCTTPHVSGPQAPTPASSWWWRRSRTSGSQATPRASRCCCRRWESRQPAAALLPCSETPTSLCWQHLQLPCVMPHLGLCTWVAVHGSRRWLHEPAVDGCMMGASCSRSVHALRQASCHWSEHVHPCLQSPKVHWAGQLANGRSGVAGSTTELATIIVARDEVCSPLKVVTPVALRRGWTQHCGWPKAAESDSAALRHMWLAAP